MADRPHDRAVEVTVIYPEGVSVTNVQELAEKAWRSLNKSITIGGVTVRVRAFGRWVVQLMSTRNRMLEHTSTLLKRKPRQLDL